MSNNGGSLSSDTGEFIFREFDEKNGYSNTLAQHLNLKDDRLYYVHSNEKLLRQKIYQIIAGNSEDDGADQLTNDPVFTQIIGADALASKPSLSRFSRRFDNHSIEQLNQANQKLFDNIHTFRESKAVIFDLDSTHSDTMGIRKPRLTTTHNVLIIISLLVSQNNIFEKCKPYFTLTMR